MTIKTETVNAIKELLVSDEQAAGVFIIAIQPDSENKGFDTSIWTNIKSRRGFPEVALLMVDAIENTVATEREKKRAAFEEKSWGESGMESCTFTSDAEQENKGRGIALRSDFQTSIPEDEQP